MRVSTRVRLAAAAIAFASIVGGTTAGAASLQCSPNPAQANGAEVWLLGCNYVVGKPVSMAIFGPDAIVSFSVAVDPSGCLVPSRFWTGSAGDYGVEAKQAVRGKKQTLMGAATLKVQ